MFPERASWWSMSRPVDRRRAARQVIVRRGELGLSQPALAEAAGVDPKTIWNLESGERWPIAKNRTKIERALGWAEGDLARIAEGRYTAAEPDEIVDLIAMVGSDEFDSKAHAVIAELPEPQRSLVEEIYQSYLDTKRQNARLFRKLAAFPRREQGNGDEESGGFAVR